MRAFEQQLYDNGYSRQEELTFRDCDRNKQMRMSAILTKMAVFGGYDYDARGLTHEKLLSLREVFLLSRAAVRIHRCPVDRDVLTIRTWEDGIKGVHMRRVYEMSDDSGAVLVSAKSDWILCDPVTRRILRPSTFTAKPLLPCPKEIDCPEPKKLRFPAEGRVELGTRRVAWSDLDGNGHLFSGNYGDIVWDYLPEDWRERAVETFFINYSKEATLGEALQLVGVPDGDTYHMEAVGPDGVCFTASCGFRPEG